jgi:RNA polymerase sigma-70 factor (ECF subfamily)
LSEQTQLLALCRAGDEQALTQLLTAQRPKLFRLALSILDDAAEADEATQEAWLAARRALPSFRGEAALSTWLYRITLNVCRSKLRKQRARQRLQQVLTVVFRWEAEVVHPEEAAFQLEADRALWAAIRALPDTEREVIVLRYYHAHPIAEVAQILNVSERTVHNRLHAAHQKLRSKVHRP